MRGWVEGRGAEERIRVTVESLPVALPPLVMRLPPTANQSMSSLLIGAPDRHSPSSIHTLRSVHALFGDKLGRHGPTRCMDLSWMRRHDTHCRIVHHQSALQPDAEVRACVRWVAGKSNRRCGWQVGWVGTVCVCVGGRETDEKRGLSCFFSFYSVSIASPFPSAFFFFLASCKMPSARNGQRWR